MNCCICGFPFEDGDRVLRLSSYSFETSGGTEWTLRASRFDDGTSERYAHISCPVLAGAPMELIGAEGGHIDDEFIES